MIVCAGLRESEGELIRCGDKPIAAYNVLIGEQNAVEVPVCADHDLGFNFSVEVTQRDLQTPGKLMCGARRLDQSDACGKTAVRQWNVVICGKVSHVYMVCLEHQEWFAFPVTVKREDLAAGGRLT